MRAMRPITPRPADRVFHSQTILQDLRRKRSNSHFNFSQTDFRKSGKPRSRTRHREDYYSPEKFRMECVLEKPVAPLLPRPPPAGQFPSTMLSAELVLWSWRRDSNPRPSDYKSDALPTELRQQLGKGAFPRKLIPRIPSRCPGQLYKVPQRQDEVQPTASIVWSLAQRARRFTSQSVRRAAIGFFEAARAAGSREATNASTITKTAATESTSGSNGLTANK